jgi:hypothetical protein
MKHLFTIAIFALAAMTIQAQTVTTTVSVPPVTTTVQMPLPTKTITAAKVNAETIASSSTKVVKNAPFSAEAVSESVQVLADGNRITRSTTTKMYRDSDGRFRREGGGGTPVAAGGVGYTTYGSIVSVYGMQEVISIFDPVENVRYILNPTDKTAGRFEMKNALTPGAVYVNGQTLSPSVKAQVDSENVKKAQVEANAAQKANVVVMPSLVPGTIKDGGKTEQLGTRSFDGVSAEGTRTVTTIAAGAIGNERPIEIVYERWYSKELDLIVYSRHYDPRFGEQTYKLVNISRAEPDRSLFTVPSDYKIISEPPMKIYTTTTTTTKPQ